MEYFIFIIVIIVVVLKQIKKMNAGSGSENSQQSAASRALQSSSASRPSQPTYRSAGTNAQRYTGSSNAGGFGRTNYRSVGSANITRDGRVYASIDFDNTHYHAEGFDFDCCISFKGLPPGTDELAVLIASNNRHERELAKLMKERQG